MPANKHYNLYGSGMNRILCVFENKILQEVIHMCNKNQIEICALMFDGLMMYGNHYENSKLLNDITEYVNSQFNGLDIVFTYKKHSDVIQIPEDYKIPDLKDDLQTLDEIIASQMLSIPIERQFGTIAAKFEKTHCKIINKAFFVKTYNDTFIVMS